MRTITYSTLFLVCLVSISCQPPIQIEDIQGIWIISEFSIDGYDKTKDINRPHKQWVELNADGTFRSGSFKIENQGVWKKNGYNAIELRGQNQDWCNSKWRIQVVKNQMVMNGKKELGTATVDVILYKAKKLPIFKQYFGKPADRIIGLWEIEKSEEMEDTGFWLRLKHRNEFVAGDANGEIFGGKFLYTESDSSLTFDYANNRIAVWKVYFENPSKIVLSKSTDDLPMRLNRIQQFAMPEENEE